MYEHDEILEWKDDTEEWLEIGTMKMTRSGHSVTTIPLDGDMIEICDIYGAIKIHYSCQPQIKIYYSHLDI